MVHDVPPCGRTVTRTVIGRHQSLDGHHKQQSSGGMLRGMGDGTLARQPRQHALYHPRPSCIHQHSKADSRTSRTHMHHALVLAIGPYAATTDKLMMRGRTAGRG